MGFDGQGSAGPRCSRARSSPPAPRRQRTPGRTRPTPCRRSQRGRGRDGRHGLRRAQPVRRPVPAADGRAARRRRAAVQPVPRHRAVLPHPAGVDDRAQPPLGRHGRHLGDGHQPPGLLRLPAGQRRDPRADPARQRLEHRGVRQVAPDPPGGGDRLRPVHPVADGRGLRHLLRVHGRRDEPLVPAAVRRHHPRRARPAARGGLPPDRGPARPRDRLGAHPAVADPGTALLHLRRPRRHARAVPRRAGVDRSATRGRSTPAGTPCASRSSSARRSSASSARTPSWRPGPTSVPHWDELDEAGQARGHPAHGDLRRVRRARRHPGRSAGGRPRGARGPRQHALRLPARRQRRLGRGWPRGHDPRAPRRSRHRRRRRRHGRPDRRDRRPDRRTPCTRSAGRWP